LKVSWHNGLGEMYVDELIAPPHYAYSFQTERLVINLIVVKVIRSYLQVSHGQFVV